MRARAGNVTVSVSGTVKATGVDANGIMAQSEGLGGNGTVKITVNAGAIVQGGTGNGRSILVLDGNANNTIVNSGTVGSSASLTAVETGDPADRIRNSGVIVGSVDLGKGRNGYVNGRAACSCRARRSILAATAGSPTVAPSCSAPWPAGTGSPATSCRGRRAC